MSSSEGQRRSHCSKRLCAACRERKARFKYRGEVRADRDHTLCIECYRGQVNRTRARLMSDADILGRRPITPAIQGMEIRALNERQVGHRRLMLGHLQHSTVERQAHAR
jgi:hypothetical protein